MPCCSLALGISTGELVRVEAFHCPALTAHSPVEVQPWCSSVLFKSPQAKVSLSVWENLFTEAKINHTVTKVTEKRTHSISLTRAEIQNAFLLHHQALSSSAYFSVHFFPSHSLEVSISKPEVLIYLLHWTIHVLSSLRNIKIFLLLRRPAQDLLLRPLHKAFPYNEPGVSYNHVP